MLCAGGIKAGAAVTPRVTHRLQRPPSLPGGSDRLQRAQFILWTECGHVAVDVADATVRGTAVGKFDLHRVPPHVHVITAATASSAPAAPFAAAVALAIVSAAPPSAAAPV